MARSKYTSILLATLLYCSGVTLASKSRPNLFSGGHQLGLVLPGSSGWGWQTPTTPPPTTPGWTTPPPTTIGWTTPGWTTPPPTTIGWTTPGWTTPPPTTIGWTTPEPTVGWTTLPPPTSAPGWTPPTGWSQPGWGSGWAGWGWGGWAPPPPPQPTSEPVTIEMVGESAVVGEGESGATHGSETSVTGDASNPAVAIINTGSYSSLGQGSGILQISGINSNGESNTFQGVDGYNFGDSGEYYGGSLSGNTVNTLNGGGSFVLGQGAIGQGGFTLNNSPFLPPPPMPPYPYGWKQDASKEDESKEKDD